MATSFPSSLDSFTNPLSSDTLSSPSHSAQHANVNDAVEALQVKVGIDSSVDTSSLEYRIAQLEAAGSPIVKVEAFTSSGTWTVPAGVTYAIAYMRGGGAGFAHSNTALGGTGGTSSVAFASGTVSATGGGGTRFYGNNPYWYAQSAQPNSGKGAHAGYDHGQAPHGTEIVAGSDVTAGASITVTVGAGGAAGSNGAAGGSGYVWIEYQES